MVASAEAHELMESLSVVMASVSDLVGAEDMEKVTFDFGPSQMSSTMLKKLEDQGCFALGAISYPAVRQFQNPRKIMLWFLRISSPAAFASLLSGLSGGAK